jgi:hypothetical protein
MKESTAMARTTLRHRTWTGSVLLLAAAGLALAGCSGSSSDTSPTAVLTPGPPPPPGPTGAPAIGISTLPPVPVGQAATFSDVKLAASVLTIDSVQLGANGPGEIAGPGVAATVQFSNESDKDIDLGGVTVNAYYGGTADDKVPAAPSDAAPAGPVSGSLAPQQTRSGVYVFQVPAGRTGSISVEVNYSGSADVVVVNK